MLLKSIFTASLAGIHDAKLLILSDYGIRNVL